MTIPSGALVTSGVGADAGCYVDMDGEGYCEVIDIGQAIITLLIDNAIYEYPYVSIDRVPRTNAPIFIDPVNTLYLNETEVSALCVLNGLKEAYYYTSDELNQLVLINRGRFPLFLSIKMAQANATTWPWEGPILDSYFIYNQTATNFSSLNNCGPNTDICAAINANNFAYAATTSPSLPGLVDGDARLPITVATSTTLSWNGASDVSVLVYSFTTPISPSSVTCLSGICDIYSTYAVSCRCANRQISISAGTYYEIQIFNLADTLRPSTYIYN